jgi:hypothetical protein
MFNSPMWIVYWLFDDTCTSPQTSGYVGVTCRYDDRMRRHRKRRASSFEITTLFTGSEDQCYALERELRPHSGMRASQLARTDGMVTRGFAGHHHSEEIKAKIRLARAAQPDPRLGKKHSAEAKAKMSAAQTERHR